MATTAALRRAFPTDPVAVYDDGGSIVLVRPLTDAAREWIEENVEIDAQWLGESLAVERRYARAILLALRDELEA